jgi:TRAP-type C4-dicarboxylate transport system permease small subunit
VGAILASKKNKLLALTRDSIFQKEKNIDLGKWIAKATTFLVLVSLALGSWQLVRVEMEYPMDIAPGIPRWFAQIIMPLGFGLMAIHIFLNSYKKNIHRITLVLIGLLLSMNWFNEWLFDILPVVSIGVMIIVL